MQEHFSINSQDNKRKTLTRIIDYSCKNNFHIYHINHYLNCVSVLKFDSAITKTISGSPKLLEINLLDNKKDLCVSMNISCDIRDSNIVVETEDKCLHMIVINILKEDKSNCSKSNVCSIHKH